ncbi:MAG TPA: DoxX family protein [Acidiferrobacteraceae bacterium]|nr:DoxX family protein [Acidiferrobacteraceae bacterium]HEX20368.1 DoxX family protein [Acidiferrobacteraceae bacterium]
MKRLCELSKQFAPLMGRILISHIFIIAGFGKIMGFSRTAAYMASKDLPMTEVLLALTILVELGGGLLILFGWKARWSALVIFLFLIPVTLIFHNFWTIQDAMARTHDMQAFMKNIAIMGAMLYILAYGSGPFSIGKDKC